MINVNDIYLDTLDRINESDNGQLSIDRFNRYSWIAQLNMLDWLSGDISAKTPATRYSAQQSTPEPYETQKDKDWLSPFITPYPVQVVQGKIAKPPDYYQFENMYLLGQFNEQTNCIEQITATGVNCNTSIELLDGDKYTDRCETYITRLQPSFVRPISKLVGNNFIFNPTDLGSITLEYIRYPKRATLKTVLDPVYNNQVYDPVNSVDFEWGEYARSILVWFIADLYFNFTREQSGKQFNEATGATVRDKKL